MTHNNLTLPVHSATCDFPHSLIENSCLCTGSVRRFVSSLGCLLCLNPGACSPALMAMQQEQHALLRHPANTALCCCCCRFLLTQARWMDDNSLTILPQINGDVGSATGSQRRRIAASAAACLVECQTAAAAAAALAARSSSSSSS